MKSAHRHAAALGLALVIAACAARAPERLTGDRESYLGDAAFRRDALSASLVNRDNAYARLRLARYSSGGAVDWDSLPEWSPAVAPVGANELDGAARAEASPLAIDVDVRDDAALRALGEAAFFRYPVQLAPHAETALRSRAAASRYGFWIDDARGVGGVVRVALESGSMPAFTCATCHAHAMPDGRLVAGLGNARLDLGALAVDSSPGVDPATAPQLAWGPGRLDVTSSDGSEPVRISDLRAARWLTHLHHDATLVQRDLTTLAIRIETLIVTGHAQTVRPPRVVALALAAYVWSLADTLPARAPTSEAETRGAAVFAARCAACHAPPSLTGPPIAIDVVGTDPIVGRSADRGTGYYRVPSLHGVATRPLLFHDASVSSLASLLDPARTARGHAYGLDLEASSRADLLAYLQTL